MLLSSSHLSCNPQLASRLHTHQPQTEKTTSELHNLQTNKESNPPRISFNIARNRAKRTRKGRLGSAGPGRRVGDRDGVGGKVSETGVGFENGDAPSNLDFIWVDDRRWPRRWQGLVLPELPEASLRRWSGDSLVPELVKKTHILAVAERSIGKNKQRRYRENGWRRFSGNEGW